MNHYTAHTAEVAVPMTEEDAARLNKLLKRGVLNDEVAADLATYSPAEQAEQLADPEKFFHEDDYQDSGLRLSWYEGGGYLCTADESSNGAYLPDEFLTEFGKLIGAAGMPYLEIGFAHHADRPCPGSHSGGACRIYPDGELDYPTLTWARDTPMFENPSES